ncbi:MAG: GyrI-like domain-containing protein [Thermomicrobiales bacterium]
MPSSAVPVTSSDLKALHPGLWDAVPGPPALVDVPPLSFLALDGAGAPSDPPFDRAIAAVVAVAQALSPLAAPTLGALPIMPLEVWIWTDPPEALSADRPDLWRWTVALAVPDGVTAAMFAAARAACGQPGAADVRLDRIAEGPSLQMLHVGPYEELRRTVGALRAAMAVGGWTAAGRHHELYLNIPGTVPPEELLTIVRQPVRPVAQ